MKKKILKSFITMGIIFYLGGCTSLKNYFGKRDIKSATTIYNKEGITLKGVKKLAAGIEATPDSQEGLSLFNVQFTEIISEKNRILQKEKLSKEDIEKLTIFIYAGEKAGELSGKVPNIIYNREKYRDSKKEIVTKIEKYILDEDYKTYSRQKKIKKINECKQILKYISSPKIYSQKLKLEEEVTIDVSIIFTKLGYDTLSNVIRGELYRLSVENRNSLLDDYIYFRGYGKDSETDYLIELEIFKENIYTKRVAVEENENKEKIFIKEKEIILDGYYNLIKLSDRKILNRRPFKVNKDYTIKTVQGDNQLLFDSEREIVEKVLNQEFREIFIRDINFLMRDVEI